VKLDRTMRPKCVAEIIEQTSEQGALFFRKSGQCEAPRTAGLCVEKGIVRDPELNRHGQ